MKHLQPDVNICDSNWRIGSSQSSTRGCLSLSVSLLQNYFYGIIFHV